MDHRFPAIFVIGRKIGLADAGWRCRESATGSGQLGRIGFIGGNGRRRANGWFSACRWASWGARSAAGAGIGWVVSLNPYPNPFILDAHGVLLQSGARHGDAVAGGHLIAPVMPRAEQHAITGQIAGMDRHVLVETAIAKGRHLTFKMNDDDAIGAIVDHLGGFVGKFG